MENKDKGLTPKEAEAQNEETKGQLSEIQKTISEEVQALKEQLSDELKKDSDDIEKIMQNDEFNKRLGDIITKRLEMSKQKIAIPEDTAERCRTFLKAVYEHDKETLKAMSTSTDSSGGYTVPEDFIDILITPPYETGNIDALGFTIRRDRESGDLPRVTGGVSVSRTAQNTVIDDSDPTFGQESYNLVKAIKGFTYIPQEFMDFSAIDAPAVLQKLFMQALNDEKWEEFVVGAGGVVGKGLDEYSSDGVITQVAQSGTTAGFVDLVNASIELANKYQPNARWLMRKDTYRYFMSMTDDNGRPLFLMDTLTSPKNHTLMSFPVELNDNLVTTHNGSDRNIYFGDFNGYWKIKKAVGGYVIAMSDQFAFDKDQITVRVKEYDCGRLVDYNSFVEITGVTLV
jgi:HK97 family phage major capsid protein